MNSKTEDDQAVTEEQLSDAYFAGTSDGKFDRGDKTVKVPKEGYETDTIGPENNHI